MRLWKHPDNARWYVLYGPRLKRRISTGTKDRAEANIYLAHFSAGAQEPVLKSPMLKDLLPAYRDEAGKDFRGQDGLKGAVRALVERLGDLKPDHITPTVLKRYALQRGASNGTIIREVGVLRAALVWAKSNRMIPELPIVKNPVSAPAGRQRWLTKDEAQRLLQNTREPHIRLFILMGLTTAARMGAILEARWDQIDWQRKTIDYGPGHGKKNRSAVPLNKDVLKALKLAQQMACSDFIIEYHGRPVKTIKKGFKLACLRAGLSDVTPHILRHTAASWMLQDKVPLPEVARMLGDSERTVERIYAKWAPGYLKRASRALQVG